MSTLGGLRVTVMGLGRFGGGVGVARWLAAQGCDVLVTDIEPASKLQGSLRELMEGMEGARIRHRLGGHDPADFTNADLVVANPAVPTPWLNPFLRAAREAGVPITTEIRLLVDRLRERGVPPQRIIGVTGSVGKSTTSAMLAHALAALDTGSVTRLGGNIGGSLLEQLDMVQPIDRIVLELSSAMLHWLAGRAAGSTALSSDEPWNPGLAVICPIAPNHTDWHGSAEHYLASKASIAAARPNTNTLVLCPDYGSYCLVAGDGAYHLAKHSVEPRHVSVAQLAAIAVPGAHNRSNAATAALAASIALAGDESMFQAAVDALRSFRGLEHRLQRIDLGSASHAVIAYDDSKSTSPAATVTAVEAVRFSHPAARIFLIAGGYDKQIDLAPIAQLANGALVHRMFTVGATGARLAADAGPRAWHAHTLDRAMERVAQEVGEGDVVLLSPGCASWDQFDDFRQRGKQFAELARQLLAPRTLARSATP